MSSLDRERSGRRYVHRSTSYELSAAFFVSFRPSGRLEPCFLPFLARFGQVLRDLLAHPDVTEDVRLGTRIGVMAIHGGIEADTAEMARSVVDRTGASLYVVEQGEELAWHVPSTEYDPAHSDALRSFLGHIDRAVSLHGFGRDHLRGAVLVGGTNQTMRSTVAHLLRMRTQLRVVDRMDDIPTKLRGRHPRNPVNLPASGGVQLELSATARQEPHRDTVVEAIAEAITETTA